MDYELKNGGQAPQKERKKMKKSLFNKARDAAGGALESRMVARMETEGRELTDEETRAELQYIIETIPNAGYEPKDTRRIIQACKRLIK